jgi:ankyrin repeat protein
MSSQLRQAFSALLSGDTNKLESALSGININEGAGEQTLLHAAAETCGAQQIQILLDRNANINALNRNGMTPTQVAIERKNIPATMTLLQHNPDLEIEDATGARALHWAVQSGSLEVIKALLQRKVEASPKAKFDSTPLHIAARAGFAPGIRLLAEANAYLEAQSKSLTALHIAAMKGYIPVIQELLACNASLESKNQRNWTALHVAASAAQAAAVKVLIDAGAHLVPADVEGYSPADLAQAKGFTEIVELIKNAEKSIANQVKIVKVISFDFHRFLFLGI